MSSPNINRYRTIQRLERSRKRQDARVAKADILRAFAPVMRATEARAAQ